MPLLPAIRRVRRLAHVENTASPSTTATTLGDVAGFAATFTADGSTPLLVELGIPRYGNLSVNGGIELAVVDETDAIILAASLSTPAASDQRAAGFRKRVVPTAGAHTYRVRMRSLAAGTAFLVSSATLPATLRIVEDA